MDIYELYIHYTYIIRIKIMADDGKLINEINEESTECEICMEDFDHINRAVVCPKCEHVACINCWQIQFIKFQGATSYCSNQKCGYEFSVEFLYKNFPKSFIVGDLRQHHMDEFFNNEKENKIKEVIPDIHKLKIRSSIDESKAFLLQKRRLLEKDIYMINNEIEKLEREKYHNFPLERHNIYPDDLVDQYIIGNRKPLRLWLSETAVVNGKVKNTDEEIKETKFHYKCPSKDCKGFLDGKFRCGLCSYYFCSECFELIGKPSENVKLYELKEIHKCNPDNKASFDVIKESTQPCPKCRTRIHKSSGCRQMWCTVCHTTFDYYTGKIESGSIHNPHYHEFMNKNKNNNEPRDIELCHGEVVEWTSIQGRFNRNAVTEEDMSRLLIIKRYHQLMTEMRQYVIVQYQVNDVATERYNKDLRIKFVLEEIDESTYKQRIFAKYRIDDKNRRLWEILDLFTVAGADIINSFYQIIDKDYSCEVIENTIDQLNNMVKYCNTSLNGSIEALCFKVHPIFHISDHNYVTLFSSNNHPSYLSNEFKTKNFKNIIENVHYNHASHTYI
jgi:hypothetical protein